MVHLDCFYRTNGRGCCRINGDSNFEQFSTQHTHLLNAPHTRLPPYGAHIFLCRCGKKLRRLKKKRVYVWVFLFFQIHTERLMLAMILQIHYVTECRALPRNVAPLCKRNNQNPTSSSNFVPQKQHNCQLNAYKFDRERTRTHTATETSAVW